MPVATGGARQGPGGRLERGRVQPPPAGWPVRLISSCAPGPRQGRRWGGRRGGTRPARGMPWRAVGRRGDKGRWPPRGAGRADGVAAARGRAPRPRAAVGTSPRLPRGAPARQCAPCGGRRCGARGLTGSRGVFPSWSGAWSARPVPRMGRARGSTRAPARPCAHPPPHPHPRGALRCLGGAGGWQAAEPALNSRAQACALQNRVSPTECLWRRRATNTPIRSAALIMVVYAGAAAGGSL